MPSSEHISRRRDRFAADALERQLFFDEVDASYAALRRDSGAWAEIEAERAEEGAALSDRSR